MWGELGTLAMVLQIAVRSLFASRIKTMIVGGIVSGGAVLVVVVSSLIDSVDASLRASIIDSVSGHAQIVNPESNEDLAIYGGVTGQSDVRPLEDFSRVKKAVLGVPNVRAVIPMGVSSAIVGGDNAVDRALDRLRRLNTKLSSDAAGEGAAAEYEATKDHLRSALALLHRSVSTLGEHVEEQTGDREARADLERAQTEVFWRDFESDPLGNLEFLENRVAPQALEGDYLTELRFMGTDLEAFRKAFPRFGLLEGELVPPGQRGMLLSQLYREDSLKLRTAWRLDKMMEALAMGGRTIAGDETLERYVRENVAQTHEILGQLDSITAKEMTKRLKRALKSDEEDLRALLVQLFLVDDATFAERHRVFYSEVAPLVRLYKVQVGENININAVTRAGYMKSLNVKVYGVYQFKGWEKSTFAGALCLMDLMSFRDLYGYPTAENAAEIRAIQAAAGLRAIAREDAVAELFGAGQEAPVQSAHAPHDASAAPVVEGGGTLRREDLGARVYSQEEIEKGVALSAAVLLDDPDKLEETMPAIEAAGKEAGLPLKVLSWQRATGVVGQFVAFSRLILFAAVLIIFAVALVILNNAMVMATLRRVKEFGTLRAIGAQKHAILGMVLLEAVAVSLVFGLVGTGLGAAIVQALHVVGIPARNEQMFFIFSGPRLHPTLAGANLGIALTIVLVVSIASGLYPAFLATRVTPLEAMSDED